MIDNKNNGNDAKNPTTAINLLLEHSVRYLIDLSSPFSTFSILAVTKHCIEHTSIQFTFKTKQNVENAVATSMTSAYVFDDVIRVPLILMSRF